VTDLRFAWEFAWRAAALLLAGALVAWGLAVFSNVADPQADNSTITYAGVGTLLIAVGSVATLPVFAIGMARQTLITTAAVVGLGMQLVPLEWLLGWPAVALRLPLLLLAFWALRERAQRREPPED
jgi:hypothetical protein